MHIDRGRPVAFEFNGRALSGFAGDTLASALLANQVGLVARSFKLHRPRGIFSAGIEEPSALVDVGAGASRRPNQRATLVELHAGLRARSVNCWPGPRFDLAAVNGWMAAALPAGFYYKTFKWPNWHYFEPMIRRMAGLGRLSGERDAARYEEASIAVDVLVVGAGIAGLTAAVSAAQAGANTLLLASGGQLGGRCALRSDPQVTALIDKARRLKVRILTNTCAFGIYDHQLVCARESLPVSLAVGTLRERLWKIRARAIVAATGAIERPMIFPDNDRPGVMLAGAAERYARAYGVACGRRAVLAGNADYALPLASALSSYGIEILAIADRRPAASAAGSADRIDLPVFHESAIVQVRGTRAVQGCAIRTAAGELRSLNCDLILSAGGLTPSVHLHSQAGGKLRWVDHSAMFVPDTAPRGFTSVGACAGAFDIDLVLSHAEAAGIAMAHGAIPPAPPVGGAGRSLADTHVRGVPGKQFIDLQNDVAASDIELAARENYRSIEHLKRYTTTGMGTDQGKTSNVNALVHMGVETQRSPEQVGTTKFRPPFAPVTLGALAGRRTGSLYRPLKRLPADAWHGVAGAAFEDYGGWWRPAAYPRPGESVADAALREAHSVRAHGGVFDASSLGKIEVYGPDAARFLDLMYVNALTTLGIGRARYGLLLKENGVVADDGIVARLGEERFWINTTSAMAEQTAAGFEEWLQCEFSSLQVLITSVTSQWANLTVAGPKAWDWLKAAGFPEHLAPSRLQHMSIADAEFAGMPARVLRASFTGELSYEVNLPAREARTVLERLSELAPRFDAVPFGLEALQILRVEKGYVVIGSDTDGTTLPGDIGHARKVLAKGANFVGRRSLSLAVAHDEDRTQLVGIEPLDRKTLLPVGAHIASSDPPTRSEGHITSSVMSAALGRPIALAMLRSGGSRIGERIRVHHLGESHAAEVVATPFFDPAGGRLHG